MTKFQNRLVDSLVAGTRLGKAYKDSKYYFINGIEVTQIKKQSDIDEMIELKLLKKLTIRAGQQNDNDYTWYRLTQAGKKTAEIRGDKTIKFLCPDCELNDEFQILEVQMKPHNLKLEGQKKYQTRSGRYRCICTACGYQTTITSKSPMQNYAQLQTRETTGG